MAGAFLLTAHVNRAPISTHLLRVLRATAKTVTSPVAHNAGDFSSPGTPCRGCFFINRYETEQRPAFYNDTQFKASTDGGDNPAMQQPVPFLCPTCSAKYKIARIEAADEPDCEITCVSCGAPLSGREGTFFLKYFLIERPRGKARLAPLELF